MAQAGLVGIILASILIRNCYFSQVQTKYGYPFTTDDLNERQDTILNMLRKNLIFDVNEEILPSALLHPNNASEFRIRNSEGETFSIGVHQPEKEIIDTTKRNPRDRPELTNANVLSKMLKDICALLPSDYWTVEWCHR